jgi:hypothetical protein
MPVNVPHDIPAQDAGSSTDHAAASLPGEAPDEFGTRPGVRSSLSEPAKRSIWSRRNALLAGAALVFLVGVTGAAFSVSGTGPSAPGGSAQRNSTAGTLIAPAASLAKGAQPAAPEPATRQRVVIPPKNQQVAEILALGASGTAAGTPARPDAGHESPPAATASVSASPGRDTATAASPTIPPAAAPPISANNSPTAVPPRPRPEATAPATQPATEAASRQAEVPDAQWAALLARLSELSEAAGAERAELASLRDQAARDAAAQGARLDDFDRRLATAEAKPAATAPAAPAAHPTGIPRARAAAIEHPAPLAAGSPAPAGSATAKHYKIQAASPTLALLAEVDRSGDEGAALEVAVGEVVPGYGEVKSIHQEGTSWVVETETAKIQ